MKFEKMEDGDVVRVYLANANPAKYSVSFEAKEGANGTPEYANVMRDLVKPIADLTADNTFLEGTRIDFAVNPMHVPAQP